MKHGRDFDKFIKEIVKAAVVETVKELRKNGLLKRSDDVAYAEISERLFEYYIKNPHMLPEDFHPQMSFEGLERTVCDYIAGMTDNYAVDKYTELFIPSGWQVRG